MDDENNPWTVLSKELVYESPWLAIHKHQVINPAGNPAVYSTVHYKNIAIGILPLDENLNTWLVGQWRFPLGAYSWEIPEGGGDPNVPLVESAKRELAEETGLKAGSFNEFMRLHTSNSASDELAVVFLAQDLSQGQSEPEETEVLKIKKISLVNAYNMVVKGEITDAISVAAILRAYQIFILKIKG